MCYIETSPQKGVNTLPNSGKKWVVRDRHGNEIYLTEERWKHILEYHPELEGHLDDLLDALRTGRRRQEPADPSKYRYYKRCDSLLPDFNHIVVIVVFTVRQRPDGTTFRNNFVTTSWPTYIYRKR